MNQSLESYNEVAQILADRDHLTVAVMERLSTPHPPILYHHLDRSLQSERVEASDVFVSTHAQLFATSQVRHAWHPDELHRLRISTRIH